MAIQQLFIAFKAAISTILTNGSFSGGGTGWTFDTGGNFTNDMANFTNAADQKLTHTPTITLVNNVAYNVTWTISNWVSGAALPQFTTNGTAPAVSGVLSNTNGVKSQTLVSNGNNSFRFIASSGGANMSIDDVSIVEAPLTVTWSNNPAGGFGDAMTAQTVFAVSELIVSGGTLPYTISISHVSGTASLGSLSDTAGPKEWSEFLEPLASSTSVYRASVTSAGSVTPVTSDITINLANNAAG